MENFADLIAAQRPLLMGVARQRLRNGAWIEDAVSETVVAALERPGAFHGQASLRVWLVGILHHKIVDQIRRHTRECQLETSGADEPDFSELADTEFNGGDEATTAWGDPQERLSRRQFMAQVQHCLKTLPAQQSRAFMLRNWRGEEVEDICHQLGITSNNLAVTLHRARGRLRTSLQSTWQGDAGAVPSL